MVSSLYWTFWKNHLVIRGAFALVLMSCQASIDERKPEVCIDIWTISESQGEYGGQTGEFWNEVGCLSSFHPGLANSLNDIFSNDVLYRHLFSRWKVIMKENRYTKKTFMQRVEFHNQNQIDIYNASLQAGSTEDVDRVTFCNSMGTCLGENTFSPPAQWIYQETPRKTWPDWGLESWSHPGDEIRSISTGRIVEMDLTGSRAIRIGIYHGIGLRAYYGNLSEVAPGLALGKRINAGELIGLSGMDSLRPSFHLALENYGTFLTHHSIYARDE